MLRWVHRPSPWSGDRVTAHAGQLEREMDPFECIILKIYPVDQQQQHSNSSCQEVLGWSTASAARA